MKILIPILLLIAGCAATGPSQDLNHQNEQAAQECLVVLRDADVDSQLKQYLEVRLNDIVNNSRSLATDIGPAETPIDYSAEASADARARQVSAVAKKSFLNRIVSIGLAAVDKFDCTGLIVGIAAALGIGAVATKGILEGRRSNGVA